MSSMNTADTPPIPDFLLPLARTLGYFIERGTDELRAEYGLGPGWTVRFNLAEWLELYGR